MERLNKVHVTLSHETKRNVLEDFADYSSERIISKIAEGMDGKINGDNLDIYVTSNDIRMDVKNKDNHFFASDFTFDRIETKHLDDKEPLENVDGISYTKFIPSGEEEAIYKKKPLGVLIGRIISEYIPALKWTKSITPSHIPHALENDMSKRSEIFWLPVMMKNEASYSDCVQIMDEYERLVTDWYTKAGRGNIYLKCIVNSCRAAVFYHVQSSN